LNIERQTIKKGKKERKKTKKIKPRTEANSSTSSCPDA
jgi:hypothetical protein